MQYCTIIITVLLQKHLLKMWSWQSKYHSFALMDSCCNGEGGFGEVGGEDAVQVKQSFLEGGHSIDSPIDSAQNVSAFYFSKQNPHLPPDRSDVTSLSFTWNNTPCRLLTALCFCTVSTTRQNSIDMSKSQMVSQELQPIKAIAARESECLKHLQFFPALVERLT